MTRDAEAANATDRSPLLYEVHSNGVALITLNRPAALNALSPELIVRLARAWRQVHEDHNVRCAVVTGTGARAFCAGADLKLLVPLMSGRRGAQDPWDQQLLTDGTLIDTALLKTFDCGKPVISAINGLAMGGGFELVQGTDLRVMAIGAHLALPEVTKGLFPNGGSTVNLPSQVPYAQAMEMLLLGSTCDASQAMQMGLINRIVPTDQVLDQAMSLASRLAQLSPLAVQAIRRSVRAVRGLPAEQGYRIEAEIADEVFASDAAAQGLAEFQSRH